MGPQHILFKNVPTHAETFQKALEEEEDDDKAEYHDKDMLEDDVNKKQEGKDNYSMRRRMSTITSKPGTSIGRERNTIRWKAKKIFRIMIHHTKNVVHQGHSRC